jgi:hypothetical protein
MNSNTKTALKLVALAAVFFVASIVRQLWVSL